MHYHLNVEGHCAGFTVVLLVSSAQGNTFKRKENARKKASKPPTRAVDFCVECGYVAEKNHRCYRTNKRTTTMLNNIVNPRQTQLCFTQQLQTLPRGNHEILLQKVGNFCFKFCP